MPAATSRPEVVPVPSAFESRRITRALHESGLLIEARGPLPDTFTAITDDSRQVVPGALFVAVRGTARDGHDYLAAAAQAGAAAAVVEAIDGGHLSALIVRDARAAAAIAAAAAYDEPAADLDHVIAVTGTNGKSTTVSVLRHLFDKPGATAASIGTIGAFVGSESEPLDGGGGLTTPGSIELQRMLRMLVARGVRTLALEASSHSLDQHRMDGVTLDAAIFTNLTRDHLDYHGTMDRYFAAKARLMEYLGPGGVSVVNADDSAWRRLPPFEHTVRYSALGTPAAVRAVEVRYGPRGSEWDLAIEGEAVRYPVRLPLIGDFNVANALGAAAAAWALGVPSTVVAERLSTMPQVPGRLEVLHDEPTVLRDYAHTPDALERALRAVRPFVAGRLIVVFGAGGDRDRGKRPHMGAVAEHLADVVILTSDNPRTEDPERILDDIESGMSRPHERLEDRTLAVQRAIAVAGPRDLVLLAGKGHETYQVRGATHHPFDERAIVGAAFA